MKLLQKLDTLRRHSFQVFITLVMIVGALFLASGLILIKPTPAHIERDPITTPVETITVAPSKETIVITGYGSVIEEKHLRVQAEVSGRVTELSPNMAIGGTLKEGEVLLKIDPRDYQVAVDQERAAVTLAELELKVERGKQIVAEREWKLLDPSIISNREVTLATELGKELALRQPQVEQKSVALDAARSRLAKAELDLERTVLRAPFNAVVIDEDVEIGQVITAASTVATLVSTDRFWVQVSLPIQELEWLRQVRLTGKDAPQATVFQSLGSEKVSTREGHVVRLLSDVDPDGRMARLLIAVDDPLGLASPEGERYPLLLGSYVRVAIQGPKMDQVFRIPRLAIRNSNEVWVMSARDTLEVRKVSVVYRYADTVVVDDGIQEGDRVITSQLPIPIVGMPLRDIEDEGLQERADD